MPILLVSTALKGGSMFDDSFQLYTKVWLRAYGRKVSDGLWHVPQSKALVQLTKVLEWEIERRDWYICENTGALRINIEWDGDLAQVFESAGTDRVTNVLEKIGLCTRGFGWPDLGELSHDESIWIMFNLNSYNYMISRD
jgi:hypothetical protein